MLSSVSEQIKNFSLHLDPQTFGLSMLKRKNRMINAQIESSLSQSDDDNYNKNHNKIDAAKDSMDMDASKQLLSDEIAIYKMTVKNKCKDGKTITE